VGTPKQVTKMRRDSEKSAQSRHKGCAYTKRSVKSQGKVSASVHRVSAGGAQVSL